jgi:hypothetical protein
LNILYIIVIVSEQQQQKILHYMSIYISPYHNILYFNILEKWVWLKVTLRLRKAGIFTCFVVVDVVLLSSDFIAFCKLEYLVCVSFWKLACNVK